MGTRGTNRVRVLAGMMGYQKDGYYRGTNRARVPCRNDGVPRGWVLQVQIGQGYLQE